MKYSFAVKISEHILEDNIGQLICTDAIIAREGWQEYYEDDVLNNGSYKILEVSRPWEEVLKSAPTFEGKPIIVYHPDKSVNITVKNIKEFKVGHMQNVRPSEVTIDGEKIRVLIADLVFDDPETIEDVKSGKLRDLSCGYFYEIDKQKMAQYDIMGEHLALVTEGRAGIARIMDSGGTLFDIAKYLKLDTPEKKDEYLAKIDSKDLEGIKKYYTECEDEKEEKDLVLKIVDREVNKRNTENIGTQKAQDNTAQFYYVPANRVKRGDVVHIPKHEDADRVVAKVMKDKYGDEVILLNKSGDYLHMTGWDDEVMIEKYTKANDVYIQGGRELTKDDVEKIQDKKTTDEEHFAEDEDLELSFNEEDVAWVSIKARDLKLGDIISEVRSMTPYEIIKEPKIAGNSVIVLLRNTQTEVKRTSAYKSEDVIDLLVNAETGEKVTFGTTPEKAENKKANDAAGTKLLMDISVGDRIIDSKGNILEVTSITENDNGTFNVTSGDIDVYIEGEPNLKVAIE